VIKYVFRTLIISLLTFFVSCQSGKKNEASTYTVKITDFEDYLTIGGVVEAAQAITYGCPRRADGYITYIVEDGVAVKDSDVVCIIEDKDVNTRFSESSTNLEIAIAGLSKTKADLDLQYSLMEAQVKNNAAETDIANLDSVQFKYLSPKQQKIKQLELEIVAIQKRKLQKKLRSLAIINQSELKKKEFEIQRYTSDIRSSKEQMDGLVIRSTKSGRIFRAMYYKGRKVQIGDNVWNGMPVVNIPDLTKMKVKITASEGEYKRINENDVVEYTFDSMSKNRAWGKIVKKSPMGQPIKENSKIKVFEIEASVDTSKVTPDPGLTTNCKIILKKIKNAIVIPQITIFEQDSMKVVYVKKSGKYEMRQILTGVSSQKSAVVIAGLQQNEKISFIKPESDLIGMKTLLTKSTLKKYSQIR
jgi:multidrug efflux pump subunit AcrA (membrane-fusion protein)